MGYNQDRNTALNEDNSIGLRYVSLLHCITSFCWLTDIKYWDELRHLYHVCNFRQNSENSSAVIIQTQQELDRQRRIFLTKLKTFSEKRKGQKKAGIRQPLSKDLKELNREEDILVPQAILIRNKST